MLKHAQKIHELFFWNTLLLMLLNTAPKHQWDCLFCSLSQLSCKQRIIVVLRLKQDLLFTKCLRFCSGHVQVMTIVYQLPTGDLLHQANSHLLNPPRLNQPLQSMFQTRCSIFESSNHARTHLGPCAMLLRPSKFREEFVNKHLA